MMKIEYNKTFTFEVPVMFGDLPKELLHEMFKDGRVASKFLENHIPVWFPELEFVDAKGYDHVNKETGRQLDAKCFTKGGLCFAPSVMLGAGRKIDSEAVIAHAKTIDYIACDVVDFPTVRIRFVTGTDLLENYPNKSFKISSSKRKEFLELAD